MARRLRLGEMLVEKGLITKEQRDSALEIQKQNGKRIGVVLIEMGVITEKDVISSLAVQLGIPYIDLSNYLIEPVIVRIIPENISRRHMLVPISKVGNKLTVAMNDPLNILAIDDIQFMTGVVVKPVMATSASIVRAIDNVYGSVKDSKHISNLYELDNSRGHDSVITANTRYNKNLLNLCSNCSRNFDNMFSRCPHCGVEIENSNKIG